MNAPIISGALCLLIGVTFTLLWPRLLHRYQSLRDNQGTEHLYAREYWFLIGAFYVIGLAMLIVGIQVRARWIENGWGVPPT